MFELPSFQIALEIKSPGMLSFGYTLDDFIAGVSRIRNKVIARVFRELGLMEGGGQVIGGSLKLVALGGMQTLFGKNSELRCAVTLFPHEATKECVQSILTREKEELTLRQQKILKLCCGGGPLTAKEIHRTLAEGISERTLRNDLVELKTSGWLKKLRSGPSTSWVLSGLRENCKGGS